jgi:hypothetical protein
MEQLRIQVPYSFIRQRTRLSWSEVKYGIEEGILQPREAIDVAMDALELGASSEHVLALASSSADDPLLERVAHLASQETPGNIRAIQRKWAFLVLAWVNKHKNAYGDPLDIVEKLYADLDYPEELAPLVRYMPSDEPDLGSKELNEQRLLQKWASYLQEEARHFRVAQA